MTSSSGPSLPCVLEQYTCERVSGRNGKRGKITFGGAIEGRLGQGRFVRDGSGGGVGGVSGRS